MLSADGRYVIVFNGEIYNFTEIRKRLIDAGHSFSGTGDTEVVLAAVCEWGDRAVDQMIGMFAFALWDNKSRRLALIRDRIGVKPLYYGWDGKTLWFGSELKSLRAFKHWKAEIDATSLGEFLRYGYIAGNRTIYSGIRKLEPGHRLVLTEDREPIVERYWSVLDARGHTPTESDEEIENKLEKLLADACRYRMVADVPVGVYLSGGIDSSVVTSLLARHHNQEIRTFTIGFDEDSHDESKWAKKVAAHCGTTHTEYVLGVSEALEIAKDWGNLFDEPFADSSGIPTLLVSRLARKEVKVVLSADGGDELFSGYDVYGSVLNRLDQLGHVPNWLGSSLAGAIGTLSPRLPLPGKRKIPIPPALRGRLIRKVQRLGSILREPTAGRLREIYLEYWLPDEIAHLIGAYEPNRPDADAYPGSVPIRLSLLDLHNYLPEDILTKVDRTTMAASIEGREPLLDHRLVEYAFNLPEHLRRGQLGPKHLLKKILYRHVPRELVDRPKKGFSIPLQRWLKTDLKNLVLDHLEPSRIREAGLMDPKLVANVVARFYAGDSTLGGPLWSLLAFEMWRERWG